MLMLARGAATHLGDQGGPVHGQHRHFTHLREAAARAAAAGWQAWGRGAEASRRRTASTNAWPHAPHAHARTCAAARPAAAWCCHCWRCCCCRRRPPPRGRAWGHGACGRPRAPRAGMAAQRSAGTGAWRSGCVLWFLWAGHRGGVGRVPRHSKSSFLQNPLRRAAAAAAAARARPPPSFFNSGHRHGSGGRGGAARLVGGPARVHAACGQAHSAGRGA